MKRSIVALAATSTVFTGCNSDKGGGNPACRYETHAAGAIAQFNADGNCHANPWPSDELLVDGALQIGVERFAYVAPPTEDFDRMREYLAEVIASLDANGFSTIAPFRISFDHAVDPATAADGFHFFRFDGATPSPDATAFVFTWDAELSVLEAQPQTPLAEGVTYGVVISAGLLDTDARPTARSRSFTGLLANEPPTEITALLAAAEGEGIDSSAVALAFRFTTMSATADLVAIRDRIFGAAADVLVPEYDSPSEITGIVEGVFTDTSAGWASALSGATEGSNLAMVAVGTFDPWDFRGADGSAIDADLVTGTATPPTNHIDFRIAIPEGPTPPGGWPVLLFAHGLGGSAVDAYEIGDAIAAEGFAVVGISAIQHGRRGNVTNFFNWEDLPATREHFRQTSIDHLQLVRLLRNGKAGNVPPFDLLDVDDVTYFGVSLGGIMGSAFLSVAPYNTKGLLVVPGGHLSLELEAETVGDQYLHPFIASRAGLDPTTPEFATFLRAFMPVVQLGLDAGDPVNYATHVVTPGQQLPGTAPKRVLQMISIGDTWVINDANYALQRALGIDVLTPPIGDGGGVSGALVISADDWPEVAQEEPHGWFGDLCAFQEVSWNWIQSDGTAVSDPQAAACLALSGQ